MSWRVRRADDFSTSRRPVTLFCGCSSSCCFCLLGAAAGTITGAVKGARQASAFGCLVGAFIGAITGFGIGALIDFIMLGGLR